MWGKKEQILGGAFNLIHEKMKQKETWNKEKNIEWTENNEEIPWMWQKRRDESCTSLERGFTCVLVSLAIVFGVPQEG